VVQIRLTCDSSWLFDSEVLPQPASTTAASSVAKISVFVGAPMRIAPEVSVASR
jgi:hypothetical protein